MPTPLGSVLCLERTFPLDHEQGRVPLGMCLEVPRHGWQRLLPATTSRTAVPFDASGAVFVDLETTGLGRGTGTYAFLVGIGRFTRDGFRVRQYFMRSYPEEPAVLAAVRAELEDAQGLITFNGRTFDWPLLETRATLNRMRLPYLPHLDLLHPARRVWRPVTDSCRLGDLEAAVLGLERHDDVPGALIPQLYFNYVRTGDARPLAGVFEHNRLDIVSMAAMAGYLGHAAAAPLHARPAGAPLSGVELLSLGRLLLDREQVDEAIACFREALQRGVSHGLRREAYKMLAVAYRRWPGASTRATGTAAASIPATGAAAACTPAAGTAAPCTPTTGTSAPPTPVTGTAAPCTPTTGTATPPTPVTGAAAPPANPDPRIAVLHDWVREDSWSTWPCVELAKYYEHKVRDLHAARAWTLRAIELVQRRRALRGLSAAAARSAAERELEELLHRLRRIEAKLAGRPWTGRAAPRG